MLLGVCVGGQKEWNVYRGNHPCRLQESNWPDFEAKMKEANLSDAAIAAFKQNYDQLVAGVTGLVRKRWSLSVSAVRQQVKHIAFTHNT